METLEGIGLHPDKVSLYRRGLHIQTGEIPPVVDGFKKGFVVDRKWGRIYFCFQRGENGFVEKGDLEEKILLEDLFVDPELFRAQPDGGNPAAFPVSPVVHLNGGFENMAAAHRECCRQTP